MSRVLLTRTIPRLSPLRRANVTRSLGTHVQPSITSSRFSTVAVSAALGGTAVLAAYFFWPDTSRSAPTYEHEQLSPTHFTPVTVSESVPCSNPNTRLVTLTVPRQSLPDTNDTSFSPVWSVFIKDDDIQVERPYTPLEGMDDQGNMKFWIKKYPKGEVGRWIHSKKVGEQIEIRGPLKTWPWKEGHWDEIIMISGGTGITPFYQLLHQQLFSQPSTPPGTRFTLLHSSRTPGELPPPEILEPIISFANADPTRLKFSLYVDSLGSDNTPEVARRGLREGRIARGTLEAALGLEVDRSWWKRLYGWNSPSQRNDRKVLFLVCGPDPMVAAIAGPFGRNMSQGPVGGVLDEMGYKSDQVWKL